MDAWAAANIKLRADRDAMNETKRKQAQQRAAADAMLADPRGAALCATPAPEPEVPMHAWFIDSAGDLYRITLH